MSDEKRRPTYRLTAKNKQTKEVIELGVAWPANEQAPGCYPFSLSKEMTPAKVAGILAESGKAGDYFLDLRENKPRQEREDF